MKHAKSVKGGKSKADAESSAGAGHGTKLLLAAILVAGVVGGVYVVQAAVADGQPGGAQAGAPLDGDVVTVPLSDLSTQAKKYTTESDGKSIRYLAVMGSDGKPRAAFDGCEVCGGSMGFRQEGGDMVCNKCGKRFRIDDLGGKNVHGGGCMPINLPFTVADGGLVIGKADLSAGARLF